MHAMKVSPISTGALTAVVDAGPLVAAEWTWTRARVHECCVDPLRPPLQAQPDKWFSQTGLLALVQSKRRASKYE
jgi:hypothetical protein